MKKLTDDKFLVIILLVIQVILVLFKTGIYIIFDQNLLDLDKYLKRPNDKEIDYVLTLLAIIRLFLAISVLYLRKFQNDLLSYGLGYLIFLSLLRFYYQYLILIDRKNPTIKSINLYQDINSLLLFFISGYILIKIFYY